ACYAVAKYQYFGYLLPNPYYIKSAQFGLAGGPDVVKYVLRVATRYAPVLAGIALFLPSRDVQKPLGGRDSRNGTALLIVPPIVALVYYATIVHEMGQFSRFSYPTCFYFILLCAGWGARVET